MNIIDIITIIGIIIIISIIIIINLNITLDQKLSNISVSIPPISLPEQNITVKVQKSCNSDNYDVYIDKNEQKNISITPNIINNNNPDDKEHFSIGGMVNNVIHYGNNRSHNIMANILPKKIIAIHPIAPTKPTNVITTKPVIASVQGPAVAAPVAPVAPAVAPPLPPLAAAPPLPPLAPAPLPPLPPLAPAPLPPLAVAPLPPLAVAPLPPLAPAPLPPLAAAPLPPLAAAPLPPLAAAAPLPLPLAPVVPLSVPAAASASVAPPLVPAAAPNIVSNSIIAPIQQSPITISPNIISNLLPSNFNISSLIPTAITQKKLIPDINNNNKTIMNNIEKNVKFPDSDDVVAYGGYTCYKQTKTDADLNVFNTNSKSYNTNNISYNENKSINDARMLVLGNMMKNKGQKQNYNINAVQEINKDNSINDNDFDPNEFYVKHQEYVNTYLEDPKIRGSNVNDYDDFGLISSIGKIPLTKNVVSARPQGYVFQSSSAYNR
jgi:hypothetical protein